MKKEFVPYELAVKLKALGFNEPCFGYYLCENSAFGVRLEITTNWIDLLPYDSSSCKAPLYQQAFRWFRENGKVAEVFSQILPSDKFKWGYKIQGVEGITDGFLTYQEAELACLTKLIEIVEQSKN